MALWVEDLEIDDWNEVECARHGVTMREVRQVLEGEPAYFPNKKSGSATLVMVGPTAGGRMLTVPLSPTAIEGVWRPATAWDSSAHEANRYHAARGTRPRR
jgi:hypothetical protein